MINLSAKGFKPAVIVYSVIVGPMLILCVVATILTIYGLIPLIFLGLLYVSLLIVQFKDSKSKDHYMIEESDHIKVKWNKYYKIETIKYVDIIQFDYYKLTSFIGWVNACGSSIAPNCIYITYLRDGKDETKVYLGHLDYRDALQFARKHLVKFVSH